MQGADLLLAQMQGAFLRWAQMQGADLSGAQIWQTVPPDPSGLGLAMPMESGFIAPLSDNKENALRKQIAETQDTALLERLKWQLDPLLDSDAAEDWKSSEERQAWANFLSAPEPGAAELGTYLAELACGDDSGGFIIEGIARRVVNSEEAYAKVTVGKLIDKETCPAATYLSDETLARLRKIAAREETEGEPGPAE